MQRRNFIKRGCLACMALAGAGLLLESCGSALPLVKTTPENKLLYVPISKFTEESRMVLVRSASLENDILLVKEDKSYKALYMKCTHEGVGLTPTNKNIVCTAHGSIFDFDGNVIKEPALRPLKTFLTETDNTNVIIHLS